MKWLVSILLAFSSPQALHASERVPAVFLSHFFVILDQPTYDALRKSPEFAALASVEESRIESGTRSWSGFYVRGRQTYMEFFGGDKPPEQGRVGDSGLGLTVEEAGGVATIAALLRQTFGDRVELEEAPFTTKTGSIPWYTAVDLRRPEPQSLSTWVMEIAPGFLASRHPGERIEHPLGREQYLSWKFLPDATLDDVVGVTVALNPPDLSELSAELKLIGWSVKQRSGDGFVATGPDIRIAAEPMATRAGIRQVELRLRRSVSKRELDLGGAKLLLNHESGTFVFWTAD